MTPSRLLIPTVRLAALLLAVVASLHPARAQTPPPAVLGTNPYTMCDWGPRCFTNLYSESRSWGKPNAPWVTDPALTLDANGDPLADAGVCWAQNSWPPGVYTVSWTGSGVGSGNLGAGLTGAPTAAGWSGQFTVAPSNAPHDGTLPNNQWLTITGINAANPPHNITITLTGDTPSAAAGGIYRAEFINSFSWARVIRTMDWQNTNGSPAHPWSQRPLPAWQQTGPKGVAVENLIALANAANRDLWICIPHWADAAYIQGMARLIAAKQGGLNPNLNVYVEVSNEVWNSAFPQFNAMKTLAAANPQLTSDNQWYRIYQQVGWMLRDSVLAFRAAGIAPARVRGVLAGQAVNPIWSQQALAYLETQYGPGTCANIVYALSYADYYDPGPAWQSTPTADSYFAAAFPALAINHGWLTAYKTLAAQYGVPHIVAYEAGQGLMATGKPAVDAAMLATQTDPRAGELLTQAAKQFFAGGGALWNHFDHIGPWQGGKYGFWAAKQFYGDVASTRWPALAALGTATAAPPAAGR